jgi:hypothetical protein
MIPSTGLSLQSAFCLALILNFLSQNIPYAMHELNLLSLLYSEILFLPLSFSFFGWEPLTAPMDRKKPTF